MLCSAAGWGEQAGYSERFQEGKYGDSHNDEVGP